LGLSPAPATSAQQCSNKNKIAATNGGDMFFLFVFFLFFSGFFVVDNLIVSDLIQLNLQAIAMFILISSTNKREDRVIFNPLVDRFNST